MTAKNPLITGKDRQALQPRQPRLTSSPRPADTNNVRLSFHPSMHRHIRHSTLRRNRHLDLGNLPPVFAQCQEERVLYPRLLLLLLLLLLLMLALRCRRCRRGRGCDFRPDDDGDSSTVGVVVYGGDVVLFAKSASTQTADVAPSPRPLKLDTYPRISEQRYRLPHRLDILSDRARQLLGSRPSVTGTRCTTAGRWCEDTLKRPGHVSVDHRLSRPRLTRVLG